MCDDGVSLDAVGVSELVFRHLRTGVLQSDVFPHEQLRGAVVELLAGLLADVHTRRPAARAQLFRFGHIVNDALALQVGRQTTSAVALPLRTGNRLGFDGKRSRGWQDGFRGPFKETWLVGAEVFAFGTVEPTQELIELLPHAAQFLIAVVQHRQQFADHPLERLRIVRQRGLVENYFRGGGIRAHADTTSEPAARFHETRIIFREVRRVTSRCHSTVAGLW
jgi:hypothetical protein